jgi:hypothetical protein
MHYLTSSNIQAKLLMSGVAAASRLIQLAAPVETALVDA